MTRFTCVAEPCNKWTVWDGLNQTPAALGGKPLVGMPLPRAETVRDVLERIDAAENECKRSY
jgi:hypothetical protein